MTMTNSSCHESVFRPNLFDNKISLVTGGGSGIGRAIAIELAVLGSTVVIASRDRDKCILAAKEMNEEVRSIRNHHDRNRDRDRDRGSNDAVEDGGGGTVVVGPSTSIREEEQVDNLIKYIIETYGALHHLVNNAGGQFVCAADELSSNGFRAVVDTNLTGTFHVCRSAYEHYMRDHGHGASIVNITLGNRNGMPLMSHSGAARAAVENMTITLSQEWMESGVRINCVRPGIVWTESGFANYGAMGDEFASKLLPAMPCKRFGSPQEVASAVCWLLCEGSSYVTGTVVCVDGGSGFHFLPLVEMEDESHLPVYGVLPRRAKL